jgi:hypothetical protein
MGHDWLAGLGVQKVRSFNGSWLDMKLIDHCSTTAQKTGIGDYTCVET